MYAYEYEDPEQWRKKIKIRKRITLYYIGHKIIIIVIVIKTQNAIDWARCFTGILYD